MVMAAPILLCDTTGMSNDRWLECRMHGPKGDIPYTIGGSDVAAIFGVSPWTTPLELWMIKKGRMKPKPKNNADQLEMGHLLEPIAAYWYAKKSGNYVYGASKPGLPTIELPYKFERQLRQIANLQAKVKECEDEKKLYEKEIEAHSVRIAEVMKEHEHGILTTTRDKLLIDFVTRTTKRPSSDALKKKYPGVYADVLNVSTSRKVKVSVQPI